jgi:hypothetical protein
MMENKTPKTKELIAHMLNELDTPIKALSPWENQFIESLTDQVNRGATLSDKQFDILERIYAEKTA